MMSLLLLDTDPLAVGGQIAAIIICLFVLIFILLALAFNLAMALGLRLVREKADLIKLLRPTVESINKTSQAAARGIPLSEHENALIRTAATVPTKLQEVDKKVEQVSEKVANASIEFRARTIQAQIVLKAFLLPGWNRRNRSTDEVVHEVPSQRNRPSLEVQSQSVPVNTPRGTEYAPPV